MPSPGDDPRRSRRKGDPKSTWHPSKIMTLVYGLIWGSWVVFGLVTVWALAWAVRSGQFRRLDRAARVIFDEEEPVGEMTDTFPGVDPPDLDAGADSIAPDTTPADDRGADGRTT